MNSAVLGIKPQLILGAQFLMNFKLTSEELAEFRGKQFSSTKQSLPSAITRIVDVELRDGRIRVVHDFHGVLRKTAFSVFLLRFPYWVEDL